MHLALVEQTHGALLAHKLDLMRKVIRYTIRGHQMPSDAIRCHQLHSAALSCTQLQSP